MLWPLSWMNPKPWNHSVEYFSRANKLCKEHNGSILVQYPATFGLGLVHNLWLTWDLHQMPPYIPHFMHNEEAHQGPHLGLFTMPNLERVLKLWIASDLLLFFAIF